MSVADNYVPIRILGNGVTDTRSASWRITATSDLVVQREAVSDGTLTTLVLGEDYTAIFDSSGFVVTMTTPTTSSYYDVIYRDVPITQPDNYTTSTGFQGDVVEESFDRNTLISQQLRDDIDRSLKFPVGSSVTETKLPTPVDGYGIVWDGATGKMRNTSASLADLEGDAETVADNIASVNTVATNIASVNTVSANISDVNTVAAISSEVQNVSAISAAVVAVDANETNVNTVASNISDVQTVAGISTEVSAVAANETNINIVAADISDVNTVASNIGDVNALAAIISEILALYAIRTQIEDVAAIDAEIVVLYNNLSSILTVENNLPTIIDAANNIPKANRTATADPTVNDDAADGYSEGSLWVNVNNDTVWFLTDPTNSAAVWMQVTSGSPAFSSLTDVNFTSLANLDFVRYDSGTSKWINRTPADVRTDLGLVIGTNVQAYDADLAAIAGLTSAANKIPYFTGSNTAAMLDLSTDGTLASNSDTILPSQKAVKTYVDNKAPPYSDPKAIGGFFRELVPVGGSSTAFYEGGACAVTTNGTFSYASLTTGSKKESFIRFDSTTTNASKAGFSLYGSTGDPRLVPDDVGAFRYEARVLFHTHTGSTRQIAGMGHETIYALDFAANAQGAYFRVNTTNSRQISCVTSNASAATVTTTSIGVSTSTPRDLRIEVNAAKTEYRFYIDNALVATHTTTLPATNFNWYAQVCTYTEATGATGVLWVNRNVLIWE